jgi:hypothetical protein
MAASRHISGCNGPRSLRGGPGREKARASSAAGETHSNAPTTLETPRRWHSFISVPLRGASCAEAPALLGGGSQAGWIGAGCDASRPAAHAGDVANAGRGRSVGGGGAFGDDGRDAGANLRAPSSVVSGEGRRGLICAVSVPTCSNMVGVIGFEPTTPSSRTRLPRPKYLKILAGSPRKSVNRARTVAHYCAVSVPMGGPQ